MNLPNKLTLFRIFLIPVFILVMLFNIPSKYLIACVIFIVASITDAMDGHIARKHNLITDFGKFMDPLADKLLVISALICMIEVDLVSSWMVIIIVARELTVSILRAIAAADGKVIAASGGGKLKTISQMIAIPLLLLGVQFGSNILLSIGNITILIATLLTLYSGWEYLYKNKNAQDILHNSVGVGATYGLMLVIISIFSSTSSSISQMINYGLAVSYRYNILELFLNGFILGFISTYLIGYKKKYFGQNIYLDVLKKAINTILILYIAVFVILLGISIVDNSYLYELGLYNYSRNTTFILSQLASYILTFANIVPTTIGSNKLSILSIINGDLLFDTKLMLISIIFLSLLVLILTGYNLRKKFKNSSSNIVLIFSICYSIIITILSSFSVIYVGGNMPLLQMNSYLSNIFMGSGIFTTLIISFIYSYIILKIGYTLSDFE